MIQFDGSSLPPSVRLGLISYPVKEYEPGVRVKPPLHCFKCQHMGHTASTCKGKVHCAKCRGEHEYGNCYEGAGMMCCNCGGDIVLHI